MERKDFKLIDNGSFKAVISENYNYVFSKKTGWFSRWGKIPSDDPDCSPYIMIS